jgi:hypothetical protein
MQATQAAAYYFQDFVRAHFHDYEEAMQDALPAQWGDSDTAVAAHDCMLFLVDRADTFQDGQIPKNFASPSDFTETLSDFRAELELRIEAFAIIHKGPNSSVLTATVFRLLEQCNKAIAETFSQLASQTNNKPKDVLAEVIEIAERFPSILSLLKRRRGGKPPLLVDDEYDVQYLFQGVLALKHDDIRPEEDGPSVAGGGSRADTFLPAAKTIVEYKKTRLGKKASDYRKEIADDLLLYARRGDCDHLLVFIYDPEKVISNPRGFESDLSKPTVELATVRVLVQQG